jgi:hypothetical protein
MGETNINGRETNNLRRAVKPELPALTPLVSAQRGKFATLPEAKIESLAAANLRAYCAFVKEIEGEEPEAGAIISAGLEMLFEADQGFVRWQQEQRKKGRQPVGKMPPTSSSQPLSMSGKTAPAETGEKR